MKNRRIFAICDTEEAYAARLADYLGAHGRLPYEVLAFTGPERLCMYAQEHPVEVLLIAPEALTEEVRSLSVPHVILLTDGAETSGRAPGDRAEDSDEGECAEVLRALPGIEKYQDADRIARQVLLSTGEAISCRMPEQTKVLGIYSPISRCGKTLFALTLAQHLAEQERVLYLNLEDYSGFEALLRTTFSSDLTDMVHLADEEPESLPARLAEQTQTVGSVDFIPPAFFPEDISAIRPAQWPVFLSQIAKAGEYGTIVLDIGPHVGDLSELLKLCSRIYMPILPDPMSRAKIHQFEKDMEALSLDALCAEMIRLYLPQVDVRSAGAGLIDDLIYGRMGQFVRRLLKQEAEALEEVAGAQEAIRARGSMGTDRPAAQRIPAHSQWAVWGTLEGSRPEAA